MGISQLLLCPIMMTIFLLIVPKLLIVDLITQAMINSLEISSHSIVVGLGQIIEINWIYC
ncbi:MAG: hypothetical protein RLZZ69_3169 [Cyanobacteriota bacterium]|jgi:hypothetical protein